jgi:hypothetical protein
MADSSLSDWVSPASPTLSVLLPDVLPGSGATPHAENADMHMAVISACLNFKLPV